MRKFLMKRGDAFVEKAISLLIFFIAGIFIFECSRSAGGHRDRWL